MATAKKPAVKKTTTKTTPARKTPVKKVTAKSPTTKKVTKPTSAKSAPTTRPSGAKKPTAVRKTTKKPAVIRSFHVADNSPPFNSFKITRQTVYWLILICVIIFAQLWILKVQYEVLELLDQQLLDTAFL